MKFRVKEQNLKMSYIWLIVICMTNFFGFYKYMPLGQSFYSVDYMHICIFVCSFLFFLIGLIRNRGIFHKGIYWKQILGILGLIIIEILWTYTRYHQPISLTFKEGFYYVVPVFAYLTFVQYKRTENDAQEICDAFVKAGIMASVIAFVVFCLYTYAGINILKLEDGTTDNFRYGTIRFSVGNTVVHMGAIISITRMFRNDYSKIDILNVIVTFVQIVLINKTRTMILYMIMLILLIALFEKKVNKFFRMIIILLIILCVGGVLMSFDSIFTNAINYANNDAGIMIRFSTIEFYMNQFKKVPLLGMGLLSSSRDVEGWQLLYGSAGYFYRDDVGIVGLLNKFGLCGLIWVIWFLTNVLAKVKNIRTTNAYAVKHMILFCIITMINLCFMDYQRIMYIFVIMVLSTALQITYDRNGICKY